MDDDGLFPPPPAEVIRKGDTVVVRTIWGEEPCRVEDVRSDRDGWPIVTVTSRSGDRMTVSRAIVARSDPE